MEAEWSVNKHFILAVISLLCAVKELQHNGRRPQAPGIWNQAAYSCRSEQELQLRAVVLLNIKVESEVFYKWE